MYFSICFRWDKQFLLCIRAIHFFPNNTASVSLKHRYGLAIAHVVRWQLLTTQTQFMPRSDYVGFVALGQVTHWAFQLSHVNFIMILFIWSQVWFQPLPLFHKPAEEWYLHGWAVYHLPSWVMTSLQRKDTTDRMTSVITLWRTETIPVKLNCFEYHNYDIKLP
jgi:hypothetical protein